VQSWTVIRDHVDFVTLGTALSTVIAGIPACPATPIFTHPSSSNEVMDILKVRLEAQNWLTNVLLFPGARESPAVRQFLCYGANSVPAQYQGINWITPNDVASASNVHVPLQTSNASGSHEHEHDVDEHELQMDDMFGYGDAGEHDDDDDEEDEDDDYDDDADFFSATERYQPTVEAVTQDDMMDLQNNADDVEMIEDVGSLAQSMGASHLGRSLQLQAELTNYKKSNVSSAQTHQGLNIGRGMNEVPAASGFGGFGKGGIGNAMQNAGIQPEAAVEGLSDSFYQKAPISAPRLDSFKMIKVVGKGSFGTLSLA
jgi:hypothetical protein